MTMPVNQWQPYAELYPSEGHIVVGNVQVLPQVYSPQLENTRDVLVYLPPSYFTTTRRYPVFYMHDGQNLFDSATSFAGVEWQVDETLEALSAEGCEAIVVGLPNLGEQRRYEYVPPTNPWWAGRGDRYVAFLCDTIKPLIDDAFRTQTDRAHTGVIGSSLGGLISLYAFFDKPQVFGLCGALSPSMWVGRRVIYQHIRPPLPADRIYIDNGSQESSTRPLIDRLLEQGYRDGQDLWYLCEEGGQHTESAWARRLPGALRFLLK